MKIYEVVYDLPHHQDNIATVEAESPGDAVAQVREVVVKRKGKVRKDAVRLAPWQFKQEVRP